MTALLVFLLGIAALFPYLEAYAAPRLQSSSPSMQKVLRFLPAFLLLGVSALAGFYIFSTTLLQTALAFLIAAVFIAWRKADSRDRGTIERWGTMILALSLTNFFTAPSPSVVAFPVTVLGVTALLSTPANHAVRATLNLARDPSGSKQKTIDHDSQPSLQGGRWIGPLERILLLLLAVSSAHAAVAALVAAKGVIRFPEISKDDSGEKAEEFLIGSLTSWTLAVLGALLITSVQPF